MFRSRLFTALATAGLIAAGCSPSTVPATSVAEASPASTPTAAPSVSAPAPETEPSTGPPTSASTFSSDLYRYAVALPSGWELVKPATEAWDGRGAPGHDGATTDLFKSSTGTLMWAYAAPTSATLSEATTAQIAADAAEHPCPTTLEIDEPIAVGGDQGRFTVKHCPVVGGILVAMTAVVHDGSAYIFYFQHPPNAAPSGDDVVMFKKLLSGVELP